MILSFLYQNCFDAGTRFARRMSTVLNLKQCLQTCSLETNDVDKLLNLFIVLLS